MNLIHGQHVFRVAGFNMVLTDVGAVVFLENALGTRFQVIIDEIVSKQLFKAHTAELLPAGDYKFVVMSRARRSRSPRQTSSSARRRTRTSRSRSSRTAARPAPAPRRPRSRRVWCSERGAGGDGTPPLPCGRVATCCDRIGGRAGARPSPYGRAGSRAKALGVGNNLKGLSASCAHRDEYGKMCGMKTMRNQA